MIVVTIELVSPPREPTGPPMRKTLGRMLICNNGQQTDPKLGDYTVHVGNKRSVDDLRKIYTNPQRRGQVLGYPRLSYNVWRLVSRALRSAFPEEK